MHSGSRESIGSTRAQNKKKIVKLEQKPALELQATPGLPGQHLDPRLSEVSRGNGDKASGQTGGWGSWN